MVEQYHVTIPGRFSTSFDSFTKAADFLTDRWSLGQYPDAIIGTSDEIRVYTAKEALKEEETRQKHNLEIEREIQERQRQYDAEEASTMLGDNETRQLRMSF